MKNVIIIAVALALATCFGHIVFRAVTNSDRVSIVEDAQLPHPIVVIGSSAAGTSVMKTLLESTSYDGSIVWISQETEESYNKVFLSDVLEKSKTIDDISLFDGHTLKSRITKLFGKTLTKILPEKKLVLLDDGQKIAYKKLFLGIGTKLSVPSEYCDMQGVFTFDRLSDVKQIQKYISDHGVKRVAVIGGGLNGLEITDVLNDMKMTVYVIDRHDIPLFHYVDRKVGQEILSRVTEDGVHFMGPVALESMKTSQKNNVTSITLTSEQELACDMVIFTAGAQVDESLMANAMITMQGSGIVVDSFMRTNYQDIYAAGDAVLIRDLVTGALRRSGKWLDALKQGAVAATNMLGGAQQFAGSIFPYIGRFFDIKVISCGPVSNPPVSYKTLISDEDESYKLFLMYEDKLKGFLLYGQSSFLELLKLIRMVETGSSVTLAQLGLS